MNDNGANSFIADLRNAARPGNLSSVRDIADTGTVQQWTEFFKVADYDLRTKVVEALKQTNGPAIQPLIQCLRIEEWGENTVPILAESALIAIGEPATGQLIGALKDDNSLFRERATRALRAIIAKDISVKGYDARLEKDSGLQSFDVFFKDDAFCFSTTLDSYPAIILPGHYAIVRFGIGSIGESAYGPVGANSVTIIDAVVSKILPGDVFRRCMRKPFNYVDLGVSLRYVEPTELTYEQRKKAYDVLFSEHKFWWDTMVAKNFAGIQVSQQDKAAEIYAKGRDAYYVKNDLKKSQNLFKAAISMYTGITGARCMLGLIAIDEGDLDTALSMFEDELTYALPPMKHTAHLCLAEIYRARGRIADASTHNKKATLIDDSTKLHPEVIQKIHSASENMRHVTPSISVKGTTLPNNQNEVPRKWYEFWKRH